MLHARRTGQGPAVGATGRCAEGMAASAAGVRMLGPRTAGMSSSGASGTSSCAKEAVAATCAPLGAAYRSMPNPQLLAGASIEPFQGGTDRA